MMRIILLIIVVIVIIIIIIITWPEYNYALTSQTLSLLS